MSELSCDTPFIGQNETHDLSLYQLIPGSYPYPDTIPGIRIFRISQGESQGS